MERHAQKKMKEKLKSRETKRIEKEIKASWIKSYDDENRNAREDTETNQTNLKKFGFPSQMPRII